MCRVLLVLFYFSESLTEREDTNLLGACLLVLPHAADFLRVHVVHGKERLAPVARSVGQRVRLFAVEHGMGVHDLGSHLLGNSGEDDVTTALVSRLIVVLCDIRDLGHLAHECAGHDVAAAAVGKGEAGDHGHAADVDVVAGVDLVA